MSPAQKSCTSRTEICNGQFFKQDQFKPAVMVNNRCHGARGACLKSLQTLLPGEHREVEALWTEAETSVVSDRWQLVIFDAFKVVKKASLKIALRFFGFY